MVTLVTGANGFVGREVCDVLNSRGQNVRAALRNKCWPGSSEVEVEVVSEHSAATDWGVALREVDTVVHLASRVHVMDDKSINPLAEYRKVNVDGTENLARQAALAGVRRFIFISSIKVNGEATSLGKPFLADDTPSPMDEYGISKYEAEEALKRIAKELGMEFVIIRPPLVYGPGVKANFFSMMQWLSKGIPLPFGSINNKRSLVALGNLADLVATCTEHPLAANQIFLAGDGESLSTTELLQLMGRALDRPAKLIPIPQKILKVVFIIMGKKKLAQRLCSSLQVDISKTKEMLNWMPPVSVEEGLRKTAEYFLRTEIK